MFASFTEMIGRKDRDCELARSGGFRSGVTIADTKAVLLVGGLGTRLRSVVQSAPKALAPIGNRPFVELLIRQLADQGIRKLVMCTGYLGDQIERQFGGGHKFGVSIEYSQEPAPLGTGGAVKWAHDLLDSLPYFLVMNGDSFLEVDFQQLIQFHLSRHAMITITVVPVGNAARYGTVHVGSDDMVTDFVEKTGRDAPGLINAGIYVFNRAVLDRIPLGAVSLEKDVFPTMVGADTFGFKQQGTFIDIGTADDYAQAQHRFEN